MVKRLNFILFFIDLILGVVMEKIAFKLKDPIKIVFSKNIVALSIGNKLFCYNKEGILWNQKLHATFYKDPYGDVTITALDANENFVAVGTNFMDGKVHLYTTNGKLLWMHQFATIASLGWRPEDVTCLKLDKQFVMVGTEFMNEYFHMYTINRKRVFQKRVKGRVKDASLFNDKVIVGTDNNVHVFDVNGKELCRIDVPTKEINVVEDRILVSNNYGVIVYKYAIDDEFSVEKYWSARLHDPIVCMAKKDVILSSEDLLNYISSNGEVVWQVTFDRDVKSVFYDDESEKIYVGLENNIKVYSSSGDELKTFKVDGEPLKIGKFGDSVVTLIREDSVVNLVKLQSKIKSKTK